MDRRFVPLLFLVLAVMAFASNPTTSQGGPLHISLLRSAPARDTVVVSSPAEVRLWFSGAPREGSTTIRLLDASAQPVSVHVTAAAPDPENATVQFAQLHGTLTAGRYTVAWATVAADGATANGEIPFSVRPR